MGKLVVIEGACDGIGKSTQFNYLKEHLIKDGYVVDSHHFPSYNTYQGVPVEKYLSGEYGCVSELSLMQRIMSIINLGYKDRIM